MQMSKRLMVVLLAVFVLCAMGLPVFAGGQGEQAEDGGEIYIPVISKGFQHQFWQTVMSGAEAAGEDLGVDMVFEGPTSEAAIQEQVQMLQNALAKDPDAIALAALDTNSVMDQ